MSDEVELRDNPEAHRFEVCKEGRPIGIADYRDRGEVRTFVHTKVDDAFEGQGLASRLIGFSLDETRSRGMRVRPVCEFVSAFIERHPDYADLVDSGQEA